MDSAGLVKAAPCRVQGDLRLLCQALVTWHLTEPLLVLGLRTWLDLLILAVACCYHCNDLLSHWSESVHSLWRPTAAQLLLQHRGAGFPSGGTQRWGLQVLGC